jgi:hypothetical protein
MTEVQQQTTIDAPTARLNTLRGNCMGAAVLLIIEFALGIVVNLYVHVPKNKSFLPAIFSSAALAAHVIVALLLLGATIAALVRAIRLRRAVVFTSIGLAAILVAAFAGSAFVGNGANSASLTMALATAVAMFSYLAAVISLR